MFSPKHIATQQIQQNSTNHVHDFIKYSEYSKVNMKEKLDEYDTPSIHIHINLFRSTLNNYKNIDIQISIHSLKNSI